MDVLKNTFISQLQTKIGSLEEEIKTLESNKKSLELSLKSVDNLEEYAKLSGEKLKNEAIVTLNAEIDSFNESCSCLSAKFEFVNVRLISFSSAVRLLFS